MSDSNLAIDLDTITENYRIVARLACPARVWAVVKGNGYGFGFEPVVSALRRGGADRFVVAATTDALRLRRQHPAALILTLIAPAQDTELDTLLAERIDISVGDFATLQRVIARAGAATDAVVQIEVDTGLGRGGFLGTEIASAAECAARAESVRVRAVWTHLACAMDAGRSRRQLEAFVRASGVFPAPLERHIANSGGLTLGRVFFLDGVRPGLALYGLQPGVGTTPCFTWSSHISSTYARPRGSTIGYGSALCLDRDSMLGLVPVGFADGYPRLQRGVVLVRGQRATILGPVAMNNMILDLTDIVDVAPGDEVALAGAAGPSLPMLLEGSIPPPIPNLFTCVRTPSTHVSYSRPSMPVPIPTRLGS